MSKEVVIDAIKAAPPVAVSGLQFFGISLSEFVLALTAIYTLLLIVLTVRKLFRAVRTEDQDPACAEDCPFARRLLNNRKAKKQ